MAEIYFNPGCALSIYRPDAGASLLGLLRRTRTEAKIHEICCRHQPKTPHGSVIVNVCAGCDNRFGSLYEGVSTVSLWEVLDETPGLELPDLRGAKMSVHDPCPVRGRPPVHRAVRSLLKKMNIEVIEAQRHSENTICCGDSFYPALGRDEILAQMRARAQSMPENDVAVYCVSCIKALHLGGRRPRHLVDLLLGLPTLPQQCEPALWHKELDAYIAEH